MSGAAGVSDEGAVARGDAGAGAGEREQAPAAGERQHAPTVGEREHAPTAGEPREERPGDRWIIATLFALAFGYDTFEAIANLQQLPMLYLGSAIEAAVPWWLLIAGVVLPALLFAAALWVGRRMRLVPQAGVLLLALGVSAQLSLLAEQLARQIALAALGG